MLFGVQMFPTDSAVSVVTLAQAVEEAGLESLFVPEHTHIPVSRRTPFPGGGDLPEQYSRTLDPFVALAGAAAVTSRIKLGTGICLVIERDPIILAKEVASLDHLSNGRLLFGIGGGWNYEEMEDHGTRPAIRWRLLRERILAMKRIWADDEAEFHGEFVNFDPIWSWPKPVQQPHPPIIVGGSGPRTLDRVLEYGDEWMPIGGREQDTAGRIAELQQRAAAIGRGPIPVTIFGVRPVPEVIDHYTEIGVTRCIFSLPAAAAEVVLPMVERYGEIARAAAS